MGKTEMKNQIIHIKSAHLDSDNDNPYNFIMIN